MQAGRLWQHPRVRARMLVDLLYVCSWNEAAIVKAKVQLWHVHDTVLLYSSGYVGGWSS